MQLLTAVGATVATSMMVIVPDVAGQAVPLEQVNVAVGVDSGPVVNTGARRAVIFSAVIEIPDASWIRLTFDRALLGPDATVLRMTGLQDGAVQHHTAETLQQWRDTSAYFNGNAVKIELVSDPGDQQSWIVIRRVLIGPPGDGAIASQCGPTDDRLPSSDPRVARTSPGGCTSWMISDAANCFITAGHCYSVSSLQICEFNVPLSNSNGSWNHPPPADQYAVDHGSAQFVNGGIGNDWCYFGCFANTETGLTAFEAQGAAFDLAATPPPVSGQTIRITGHGTDNSPSTWNQIQQTHTGPYVDFFGTTLQYQVDTTGGNSGSPVINEDTGQAIGVHTHGGCNSGGGANHGTGINNTGFQGALANPEGICIPLPGIEYAFPNGLPDFLDPGGDTILTLITGANGGVVEPGSPTLHFAVSVGYETVLMSPAGEDLYEAIFPPIECGTLVRFHFSAETTEGEVVFNPLLAPAEVYSAISGFSQESVFSDDFEVDLGWTVSAADGLTDGQWERAVPISNDICDRGNPGSDADGSGTCFLTDNSSANACNSDVDNGSTILTSPLLDASNGTPFISYWRWFDNTGAGAGNNPFEDTMVVEVSDDGGSSWFELETIGPTGAEVAGGWFQKTFPIEDVVDATDQFRIRFIVSDRNLASVVEAGVDGVELVQIGCDPDVLGDLDGDGVVGITDMLMLLAAWGPCEEPCPPSCAADLDGDCLVGIQDLLLLLANWTMGRN